MSTQPKLVEEPADFSLVLGGPLYQLLRKSHLSGDALQLAYRRLLIIPLFAWLPLLLLAVFGSPGESSSRLSFFRDVEVHVRFLAALPALIAAELIVHSRLRPVVRSFVTRRIVPPADLPRFDTAIERAVKLRNSIPLEVTLLLLVYTVGLWVWNDRVAFDATTWYARSGGRWNLTPAGIWYVFISIPILQFILLRWYVRFFIWYQFLWRVSRIKLNLIPTHPDRAAGLAFVGNSVYAFGPILFAQGAMLAGVIASRVLYRGDNLLSFRMHAAGFVVFFVIAVVAPLLMFTPQMAAARRQGLADYGLLSQRYVEAFEQRWVGGQTPSNEELLGSGDVQSLADLGNSYAMVREMRPVPFGLQDITRLAVATAAPLVPLLLTIWSPEEVLMRIMKIVF